ncbi:MAG: LysR family transcriptional regulator [Microbacteriaceae bacterium]|nr:LysR family transcriptional regulator [Microbacteriaceae bacterium]
MPASFTLTQLRYFVVVARLEHMTHAATELSVTQSTLSSAISQLEREVDAQLFDRLPRRGLRLTDAGRALLTRSLRLLEDADLLGDSLHDEPTELAGELTVGIYAPITPFRAPTLLHEFEQRHPRVALTFLEGDQQSLQHALRTGRCEVALMYDLGVGDDYSRRVIDLIPPHVIVPEGHRSAGRAEASLREFADEPLILLSIPHTRDYYLSLFARLGIEPKVRHAPLGYETVRSFVALGQGYSVLNHWVEHGMTYAGTRVVPIALSDDLPPTELLLVRPRNSVPTRKSLAFEQLCVDLYGVGSGESAPRAPGR